MKWYHWLIAIVFGNLTLLYLLGRHVIPVEVVGIAIGLQVMMVNWLVLVWILRHVVRWFRSGL